MRRVPMKSFWVLLIFIFLSIFIVLDDCRGDFVISLVLHNVGLDYLDMEEYPLAAEMFLMAYDEYEDINSCNMIGLTHQLMLQYREAIALYMFCIDRFRYALSADIADVADNLGAAHYCVGDDIDALRAFDLAEIHGSGNSAILRKAIKGHLRRNPIKE